MKKKLSRTSITSFTYDSLIDNARSVFNGLPDFRTGLNTVYSMGDAALGAFSIFFTQSPSFLDFQRNMQLTKGQSNAQTLFQMTEIPSDNQIRNLLDPVSPEEFFPCFSSIIDGLYESNHFESYRSINGTLLLALDGTQYFSSKKICCENCSVKEHKNGTVTYSHVAITPVMTAPNTNIVFPLEPEFIIPQDGHNKQDCENAAAKRWFAQYGSYYNKWDITILGDDLYCKQPLCKAILDENLNFILVCKPDSHKHLYEHIAMQEDTDSIQTVSVTECQGKKRFYYTYRFVNQVPLRAGSDALKVNWCELVTSNAEGEILFKNSFSTNHEITSANVQEIVKAGRSRWKIENENNNTLKTKGYNFTHNFGHGKKHLSSVMATLNLLAFLIHTVLDLTDSNYRVVRQKLATRINFFNDLRALTRYLCFGSWNSLLLFMMRGLEIEQDTS